MGRIPPTPGGPWTGILLAASVLGSCLQPAPAQTPVSIVLTPPSPVAGGGVSLAPEPATQGILACGWYRSATTDENSRILTYIPGPPPVQSNGPAHTGRETAGPGCALHIAGLTLSDTGSYTVRIESPTSPGLGSVYLRVYDSRCRNETPTENGAPVLVYENLPPTAGAGPVAQPGSPPDPGPTYETLQARQPDLYEELKK